MLDMKVGDKCTVEGVGLSAKGHLLIDGKSIRTGRKLKVKRMAEFVAKETYKDKTTKPVILEV